MGTDRPPPYFPQGSLSPPDPKRYLKFKLIVAGIILFILIGLGGVVWAAWHFLTRLEPK